MRLTLVVEAESIDDLWNFIRSTRWKRWAPIKYVDHRIGTHAAYTITDEHKT